MLERLSETDDDHHVFPGSASGGDQISSPRQCRSHAIHNSNHGYDSVRLCDGDDAALTKGSEERVDVVGLVDGKQLLHEHGHGEVALAV